MAKNRTKAIVNPAVLAWARTSAGYEHVTEAADKLGVDTEKLVAWEEGDDQPSIPQLRRIAETYKRPLAVLYLSEPPLAFRPMHDFRRLPDIGVRRFSPDLTLEIRLAQQRRALALELIDDAGEKPPVFALNTTTATPPEQVATTIRSALGVDHALQSRWRDARVAFMAWRSRIEDQSILVFQASRVESEEASGFAFWSEMLPFMVVNRKDNHARRTFSLFHELAHLMLRQNGVSDIDGDGRRPAADEAVEAFCNRVAAATLVPAEAFLAEPLVAARGSGRHEWPDQVVQALSVTYSVSRETIVRRLLTLNRTTEVFYNRKRAQYKTEFQEQRQREREKNEGKPIPRNMPRETVADYGRPFVRRVIENYHSDRLSLSDVSGYLGVKVRHVPGIEQLLVGS